MSKLFTFIYCAHLKGSHTLTPLNLTGDTAGTLFTYNERWLRRMFSLSISEDKLHLQSSFGKLVECLPLPLDRILTLIYVMLNNSINKFISSILFNSCKVYELTWKLYRINIRLDVNSFYFFSWKTAWGIISFYYHTLNWRYIRMHFINSFCSCWLLSLSTSMQT